MKKRSLLLVSVVALGLALLFHARRPTPAVPAARVFTGASAKTNSVPAGVGAASDERQPASVALPLAAVSSQPALANPTGELRARWVQPNWDFLQKADSPVHDGDRRQAIRLDLFDDTRVDFKVEGTRYLEPGVFVTTGSTGTPLSLVVFANVHGAVVGTIIDPVKGQFTIEPTAQTGVSRIYENNPRALTCGTPAASAGGPSPSQTVSSESPAAAVAAAPAGGSGVRTDPVVAADTLFAGNTLNDFWAGLVTPSGGTRIPVLALYNADLAAKAVALFGNLDGLRARMEAGIALTNAAMARARSTAYLELVGMAQITFAEPAVPSSDTLLSQISQTSEYFDLQTKYRPALTTYMINAEDTTASGFSGVGQRPGRLTAIYHRFLNSVVTPHEFGHNFGMQHNVEDAAGPADTPYGYGWRLAGSNPRAGDLMAYGFPGIDTFILPAYSDPSITFQGIPLGDAAVADNARVARERTSATAAYAGFQFGAVGDNWITNLSTRGYVGSGDQVMIAGFIISGTAPKQVVLRGIGPSLGQFGIQQPLANPKLQLFSGSTVIRENDNWQDDSRASELKGLNLAPSDPSESALLMTLNPGAYTVIVSGVNNATGVALVEAYEMDAGLSRFSYWNANGVSSAYNTFNYSPLDLTYDFAGRFRNSPVLLKLTNSPPGKFLVTARLDSSSPVAIDPYLEIIRYPRGQNPYIMDGSAIMTANDSWQTSSSAVTLALSGIDGLGDARTAAVIADTTPDFDYWLVAAPGDPNQAHPSSGVLKVGLYDLTGTTAVGESDRLVNVSTRGVLASGEKVMIAGFIIRGTSSRTVIVRVLSPSLAKYGLGGLVQNPKLTIFDASSHVLAANDDWQKDPNQTIVQKWGLAPDTPGEPAMAVTLQPGAYTVVVENNGQEGLGLVEVYEVR